MEAHLSDGHGAEDVEEDEGAVGVIFAQQVTVRQPLDVRQRHEGQLCHDPAIETEHRRPSVHFNPGPQDQPTIKYVDLIGNHLCWV